MKRFVVVLFIACLCVPSLYATLTYSFYGITPPASSVNQTIGESQLLVDIYADGSDVAFRFYNTGPDASVISEIYFDDGGLLAIAGIDDSDPWVNFEEDDLDVTPGNLPGGDNITPAFVADSCFSVEAENPEPLWGVGPDEQVTITYSLEPAQTIDNVISNLADGSLRIGLHVKSFAEGDSQSFVNNPVPEPATLALLGLGGILLRRKK